MPTNSHLLKRGPQQSVDYQLFYRATGKWSAWTTWPCFANVISIAGIRERSVFEKGTYYKIPECKDGEFYVTGIRYKLRNNYVDSMASYKYIYEMVNEAKWGITDWEYRSHNDRYVFELHPTTRAEWLRFLMFGTLARYCWEYVEKIWEYIQLREYATVGHSLVLMHFGVVRNTGHTLFSQNYKLKSLKDFSWNQFLDSIESPAAWYAPISAHLHSKWEHLFKPISYPQYPLKLTPVLYKQYVEGTVEDEPSGMPSYSPVQ